MLRKSSILILSIVIMLLAGTLASGAESQPILTLSDAIQLAVEQNPTLKNSQLDIQQAMSDLDLTWKNLLPQAKVQSSYTRLEEGMPQPTGEFDTQLVGVYPWETPLGLIDFPILLTTPEYEPGSPHLFNTQLTIQQPVFLSGKSKLGVEIAKTGVTMANIQATQALNETIHNVIQVYYNLVMTQEMLQIQQTGLQVIAEQLRIAKVNFQAGLMLKKDLLQIQIEERKATQRLHSTQSQLNLAKKRFNQLLGFEQGGYQLVTPKLPVKVNQDLQTLSQVALEKRTELKSLQLNQSILNKNLKMEKRNFWPMVMILGNYQWQGDTLSFEDGSWSLTANASLNLFDGGISREKQSKLKLQLEQLAQTEANLAQMIRLEVEEALLQVAEQEANLEIEELSLQYANENLQAVTASQKVGMATATEVLQLQVAQQQAQISQAQAHYQYQLSLYNLLYQTGSLSEYLEEVVKGEN